MRRATGLGTGFIISDEGHICTNHHVIAGMDKVMVKVDGKEYRAEVVGSDEVSDIALLKIEGGKSSSRSRTWATARQD